MFKQNKITQIFLAFLLTLSGIEIATSQEMKPQSLSNTQWQVATYITSKGELSLPYSEHEPTLIFDADRVRGTSGCNQFTGGYQLKSPKLSFEPFASTQKACIFQGLSAQEQDYVQALSKVVSYKINDEQLELIDAQGKPLITFQRIRPASLTRNLWQLQNYNDNKGIVSLVPGTEITLILDENGNLSGMAGCNNYQSQWQLNQNKLKIKAPSSTRKFCQKLEGTMQQETAYLSLLDRVSSYDIEGNTLVLKDTQGTRLAEYQAELFRQ